MAKTDKTQNNSGAIVFFVKTPHYTPVKTRLAAIIGQEKATEFFKFCIKIIEETAKKATKLNAHTIIPYWAVAEKQALTDPLWRNFSAIHSGVGSLGMRLHHVYSTLLKKHSYVILLGADSPNVTANLITSACHLIQKFPHFVIGPAYDGGFYLFAGNKNIPETVWQNVNYSEETTLKQLSTKLAAIAKIEFLQPMLDVDTHDDLLHLNTSLKSSTQLLPSQKKLLVWLTKEFGSPKTQVGMMSK
jgi:uncharacterized protein